MTALTDLAAMLPADPSGDSDWQTAARAVVADAGTVRSALANHLACFSDPCQDRGVNWPCDVASALGVPDGGS